MHRLRRLRGRLQERQRDAVRRGEGLAPRPVSTNNFTTPFDVYIKRRGVCQDFANLFICLARLLNIPARYRVGYIFTGADYQTASRATPPTPGPSCTCRARAGWASTPPTAALTGQDHVRVACGRNYLDATPTAAPIFKGGGPEASAVSVKVEEEHQGYTNITPPLSRTRHCGAVAALSAAGARGIRAGGQRDVAVAAGQAAGGVEAAPARARQKDLGPCLRHYCRSGALLPHHFTLTVVAHGPKAAFSSGGMFSVALAVHGI